MAHAVDVLTSERPVQRQGRIKTTGYATHSSTSPLQPFSFERREPGPQDVQIDILYCGVCHSDLHTARNEWTNTTYPVVPGHEIVGRVVKTGAQVRRFKEGDLAAVGCMVDSDRVCPSCQAGLEQYCESGSDLHLQQRRQAAWRHDLRRLLQDHRGGRSICAAARPRTSISAGTAPLLCAGITTYSPLRHWNVRRRARRSASLGWAAWATWE